MVGAEWHGLPQEYRHELLSARELHQLQEFLAQPAESLPTVGCTGSGDLVQSHIRSIAEPGQWLRGITMDEAFMNIQKRQIDLEALQGANLKVPCRSRCFTKDFWDFLM